MVIEHACGLSVPLHSLRMGSSDRTPVSIPNIRQVWANGVEMRHKGFDREISAHSHISSSLAVECFCGTFDTCPKASAS